MELPNDAFVVVAERDVEEGSEGVRGPLAWETYLPSTLQAAQKQADRVRCCSRYGEVLVARLVPCDQETGELVVTDRQIEELHAVIVRGGPASELIRRARAVVDAVLGSAPDDVLLQAIRNLEAMIGVGQ